MGSKCPRRVAHATSPGFLALGCAPGYGGPACKICPAGTFSAGGNLSNLAASCSPCPGGGTSLRQPGSRNATACLAGACLCWAVVIVLNSVLRLLVLPVHALTGLQVLSLHPSCFPTLCTLCKHACTLVSACKPGFGGQTCTRCPIGTWSAGLNASKLACVKCRPGYTTPAQGSQAPGNCSGGPAYPMSAQMLVCHAGVRHMAEDRIPWELVNPSNWPALAVRKTPATIPRSTFLLPPAAL